MSHRDITQQRMKLLWQWLRRYDYKPFTAADLAWSLNLPGNRETRRRQIRGLVTRLHGEGYQICADCHPTQGGYWLAKSDGEWRRYLESRQSKTRFRFVRDRQMRQAASERNSGQGKLF